MSTRPRHLPRLTYRFRVLGMGLGLLPVAVVLHDLQAGWAAWAWVLAGCLAWPHLAYVWAVRHRDPYAAEARNFVLDSAIAASFVPLMHFNLLPSAVLVTVTLADKINSGVPGLWLRSLPGMAAALLIAGLATGFAVDLPSRTAVIVACLPIMAIHTLAVSANLYRLMRRVQAQNEQLEQITRRDGLTGLDSRGHWQQRAQRLLDRHHAGEADASLLLIDLDHFKAINDRHGHGAGDDVLRALASAIRDTLPDGHISGRLGGDEFVVALPLPAQAAVHEAERLRRVVAAIEFPQVAGLAVTISAGVAAPPSGAGLRAWLEAADFALYEAKRAGRDRVSHPPARAPAAPA